MLHGVGDYEGALTHYLAAYEAVRETNDERTVLRRQFLNSSIAYLQADLRDYDAALVSAQRAIDTAKSEGLEADLPDLYLLKGYIEGQMQRSEASIQSHEEAIKWAREFDYPGVVLVSMNNIGSSLIDEKQYDQARMVLEEALAEARAQEDTYTADLLLFNLGYVDVMTGNVEAGIEAIETYAERLKPDYTDADYADLLKFIAEAYVEAGFYERATAALSRGIYSRAFMSESAKIRFLNYKRVMKRMSRLRKSIC
ncbi:MAG: hypothetical protein HLUCCO02_06330 [Idiomarinaceae bacterium HL-53]|nr:MAG: hypothetical protein HLUCCO02_06330 [Idiomarinaceae bacterium HL-53]